MSKEKLIKGLCLKIGPLGENDRLLTLLSDDEGITRFAVPGARRSGSKLCGATPLSLLELQIGGRSTLKKVRQLKVLNSYQKIVNRIESLAAAQAISELSLMLVANNDPIPGLLNTVLIHLDRLDNPQDESPLLILAKSIQSLVHLLAIGGYGLPIQKCCKTGSLLNPPIGQWEWRCSLLPQDGFAIGSEPAATIELNPSELALLQRLIKPELPRRNTGELMGPQNVWLKLLIVLDTWIITHLPKKVIALNMLRELIYNSSKESKNHGQ